MDTRSGISAIWSAPSEVWPELEWDGATYLHGAFHHVAVVGESVVVRVASDRDHRMQTKREHEILRAFQPADLPFRFPSVLAEPVNATTWSASVSSFIAGQHKPTFTWAEVREPFAQIIESIRHASVMPGALPPPRQWCGGGDWPDLVARITAPFERQVRQASLDVVQQVLQIEASCEPAVVHGDFGLHNVLWDSDNRPGLIDFDNACIGDPAIDLAPLVGSFGAARVSDITDAETLERARIHRASLALQVAAAAELADDAKLRDHALGNFTARHNAETLYDPQL